MRKYFPLIIWCVLIFIGSSLPAASASKNPLIDFIFHKLVHIIEYAILFLFSYKAFNKKIFLAFLFVFVYSISDEFHQTFVPGRNGKIQDVLVDLIGAGTGGAVLWKLPQILPAKLKNWLLN